MEKANLKVVDSKSERMMVYSVNGMRMTVKSFDDLIETVRQLKYDLPHIETIGDNIGEIASEVIDRAFTISSIGNTIARMFDVDDKPERFSTQFINDMISLCGVVTDATERLKEYLQAIEDFKRRG